MMKACQYKALFAIASIMAITPTGCTYPSQMSTTNSDSGLLTKLLATIGAGVVVYAGYSLARWIGSSERGNEQELNDPKPITIQNTPTETTITFNKDGVGNTLHRAWKQAKTYKGMAIIGGTLALGAWCKYSANVGEANGTQFSFCSFSGNSISIDPTDGILFGLGAAALLS